MVAIVLTGAGRGFCAGADLRASRRSARAAAAASARTSGDPGDPRWAGLPRPLGVAALGAKARDRRHQRPCAGLGFAVALFADLRFASDRATFTTAFSRRGLIAEWGIGWTLPRLVGPAHALDLLCSARRFDAAEAERIGLVNRTLPHDELLPFVRGYVRELATTSRPPRCIMKRQVYDASKRELGPSLDEAIRLMHESFRRPDFPEGVHSYLEKRPPRFARVKI